MEKSILGRENCMCQGPMVTGRAVGSQRSVEKGPNGGESWMKKKPNQFGAIYNITLAEVWKRA